MNTGTLQRNSTISGRPLPNPPDNRIKPTLNRSHSLAYPPNSQPDIQQGADRKLSSVSQPPMHLQSNQQQQTLQPHQNQQQMYNQPGGVQGYNTVGQQQAKPAPQGQVQGGYQPQQPQNQMARNPQQHPQQQSMGQQQQKVRSMLTCTLWEIVCISRAYCHFFA